MYYRDKVVLKDNDFGNFSDFFKHPEYIYLVENPGFVRKNKHLFEKLIKKDKLYVYDSLKKYIKNMYSLERLKRQNMYGELRFILQHEREKDLNLSESLYSGSDVPLLLLKYRDFYFVRFNKTLDESKKVNIFGKFDNFYNFIDDVFRPKRLSFYENHVKNIFSWSDFES